MRDFKDQIEFLQPSNNNIPEIVISRAVVLNEIDFGNDNECIVASAKILRNEILDYCDKLPSLNWPPTVEEIIDREKHLPTLLSTFVQELLKSSKHSNMRSENIQRIIDSYIADLIYGVTRGKVVTAKHFLLALGLHSLTGARNVVDINNSLGHCISYNLVCDIETALARKAQVLAEKDTALALKPLTERDSVLTFFWVDNFDINIERSSGGGSVNTTHLLAFQEKDCNNIENVEPINLPYNKSRKVKTATEPAHLPFVDQRKEPPLFTSIDLQSHYDNSNYTIKYFLWVWTRHHNRFDQIVPSFPAWLLQDRDSSNLRKTVMTYLPPISTKVTEFSTIWTYMNYLQSLAESVNMPFVNITLDVRAAINAYKLLWNEPERFKNIVLHLGDFHFIKENFQVYLTRIYLRPTPMFQYGHESNCISCTSAHRAMILVVVLKQFVIDVLCVLRLLSKFHFISDHWKVGNGFWV